MGLRQLKRCAKLTLIMLALANMSMVRYRAVAETCRRNSAIWGGGGNRMSFPKRRTIGLESGCECAKMSNFVAD